MAGKVMLWNGKVLFRRSHGSKIAISPACCCEEGQPCNDATPDTASQPALEVTASDCNCKVGTHTGAVPFWDHWDGTWTWVEWSTTCEIDDWNTVTALEVKVTCNAVTGKWSVLIITYQYNGESLEGRLETDLLTVDINDHFTGTINVPMYDVHDNHACTLTLVFG